MKTTFPTIVYKCPGNHQCNGGTYDFIQVKSEEDLKVRTEQGYKLTLPEAMGGQVVETEDGTKFVSYLNQHSTTEEVEEEIDEISPPTREEREAKATELEIKFNSRTSDEMLDERIEAKLKEQ